MAESDLNNLAFAWLRNSRLGNDEDFWAWEEARRIIETDLDAAWKLTVLLLAKVDSDDEVGIIAAGPLEDLIDMHGHKALDLIERECEKNGRLRLALSTVGVLFYYDEFDRWYALLVKYGLREAPVRSSRSVIEKVMHLMKGYLDGTLGVGYYGRTMEDLLGPEPLDDKRAQKIFQNAYCDFLRMDKPAPPDYRKPSMREVELRARLKESLAELESLGYLANNSGQHEKLK